MLPSGGRLRGRREDGGTVEGAGAACATCHRRSGLGSWEGTVVIPPITGRVLFGDPPGGGTAPASPHVTGLVAHRPPYTPATLARALEEGVDSTGRRLGQLMPRYALDGVTLAALADYLRTLTDAPSPGVGDTTLHFATVVTPDADPVARQAMLDVLERFFADKNAGYRAPTRPLRSSRGVMYRVERRWELHVWSLTGQPESWEAQLDVKLAAQPVFALVSGIGGKIWAPVHRFCERAKVPCLLPNVLLPVAAEQDFYSVYFSRGVLLEAELIAHELAAPGQGRVVQVFRAGDVGEAAARALEAAVKGKGLAVTSRALAADAADAGAPSLVTALEDVGAGDALVLWLRPEDVRALPAPTAGAVYVSGLMGGLERAPLPGTWRSVARLTYPFDLPEARKVRMDFPLGWFAVRHLKLVDERVQTDTYLACVILSETLGHMLELFVRDFFVERVEMLLSHRLVNGYYPRLSLAPGQRFASKGGALVRFAGAQGTDVVSETGWIVP